MSILGKIVGQLEGGGSSGLNYINVSKAITQPTEQNLLTGFPIAKMVEDGKIYKFDVVFKYDCKTDSSKSSRTVISGFTFNNKAFVFVLEPVPQKSGQPTVGLISVNGLLQIGGEPDDGDWEGTVEGYTTITQEEAQVLEGQSADGAVDARPYMISQLESRIAALEDAGSG